MIKSTYEFYILSAYSVTGVTLGGTALYTWLQRRLFRKKYKKVSL